LQDNVDVIVGKHSLRFGGQLQLFRPTSYGFAGTTPTVRISTVSGVTPAFTTTNFANFGGISTTQVGTANNLLALLAGIVSQGQQTFNLTDVSTGFQNAPSIQPFKYENYSVYAADRWQITNELTLNLGVRYELFPGLRLANGLALEPVLTILIILKLRYLIVQEL
jgi:outer membrane receptor protein involved in Fe transport